MPNSLRCKLSKLRFQGKITQDEYKELIEKLEGHDEALVAQIKWERDTAIEQLKQLGYGLGEKIEPCDDCVSRQAAIEVIYDKYYDNAIAHDIVGMLFDLPSVSPQRPQGKWIEQNDTSKHHFGWYYCSNCGAYLMSEEGANYCSCCGTEMEDSND